MTREERANQRNAVLAGFLGWTLDAFDFFILTLIVDDIARAFGKSRPDIALAISMTLFMRPLGGSDFSFRHHTRSAAMGPFNAGKYVLPEAEPGDLVLFPSYLYHEVPRNQGEQRITVAFNAIPDSLDCWGYRINFAP